MQADKSDVLIYPQTDFVPAVTKKKSIVEEAIANGEQSADEAVPAIREGLAKQLNTNTQLSATEKEQLR